jgi:hypothetical protein
MTKTTRLLALVPAVLWFVACSGTPIQQPVGGMPDASGAAGNADAATTYPVTTADGRCVEGAFARNGVCVCQTDIPTVCSAGCTDTKLDDDNCGACGHKCGPTQTCNDGMCGPSPVNVVPASAGCATTVGSVAGFSDMGLSVAVSGGTLYWADAGHGTVKSQPAGGGPVTVLAMNEKAPHALAVNGPSVYWLSWVAGAPGAGGAAPITATLRKAAGGAPTDVVSATSETGGILGFAVSADGTTIYFSSGTSVKKVAAGGGAATEIAQEVKGGLPGALALDGTKIVYPTGQNGDVDVITPVAGTVSLCGKEDPATGEFDPKLQVNCLRVGRSRGSLVLSAILAKADRAYWINGASVQANPTGPNAIPMNEDLGTPGGDVTAMAMAADKIYFGDGELIEKVGLTSGSASSRIARGQKGASSIAVDGSSVYWSTKDCGINKTGL